MGYFKYDLHDIRCDYPSCTARRSVGGNPEELWEDGWTVEHYFGIEMALCGTHTDLIADQLGIPSEHLPKRKLK